MASAVLALKGGGRRGWGRAPFREEEGRQHGRLDFLGRREVGAESYAVRGCSQWWGVASSGGGRSLGGQVGRLGPTEVARPSWPGRGEVGCRLGPAGKPRRRGG
jgi:hypothetical protein